MVLQQFSCMLLANKHEWKQGMETVEIHQTRNFKVQSVFNASEAKQQRFDQIGD